MEEGEGVEGAVEEAGICFAPFVAGEGAVGLLEVGDVGCNSCLSVRHFLFELWEGVEHGEDLHGGDGVEDVCVVSRCCSKAAILVQAAEDEVDYAISWECFGMAEQVQCREAPVDAGDAEVFSEMIFELFAALLWTLVVSVAASYYRGKSEARILCPDFGCRLRACRRRVSALPAAGCWLRRLSRALLQATCRVFVSTICRRQLLFEVNRGSQRRFRRGVKYSKLLSSRADGLQATCNLNSGAYSGRSAHLTFYLSGEVWVWRRIQQLFSITNSTWRAPPAEVVRSISNVGMRSMHEGSAVAFQQGSRCRDDLHWSRLRAGDVESLRAEWLCGCYKTISIYLSYAPSHYVDV